MRPLTRLLVSTSGAGAAEFALVLPLLLILLFGIIDGGRFLWEMNRGEKATQAGARYAVVTGPVSTGLRDADFVSATLKAGELIPATAIGAVECNRSSCSCTGCSVAVGSGVDTTRFDAIVTRMQAMDPSIQASNVRVTYRGSGFGFAGDAPGGGGATETMEISPLVSVSLTGVQFTPITSLLLAQLTLPPMATTLPSEDASGAYSN